MLTHDPSEYIKGLQQILVSDKKKVAFLFGSGTSLARKNKDSLIIPAIDAMTIKIEEELNKEANYKTAIEQIKDEITGKRLNYNIETLLSNIEQKREIIGDGVLNGLKLTDLDSLILAIKKRIREIVSIHKTILEDDGLGNLIHIDFAEWIGRADRKHPIEIFTTNYDYLFELGLEEKNIPYYDGFAGSHLPFFNSDSVDDLSFLPKQTKLWKIHGSLGWHYDENSRKVLRKDSDGDDILIYPSTLKYNESKKQPYIALMDRLTNFLKQPDTILITCGYAFGDEHINERIITALNTNTSAHVFALFYDIKWKDGKKDVGNVIKSAFTKIDGMSEGKSEKIREQLKANGVLNENYVVNNIDLNDSLQNCGLDTEFNDYRSEIVVVLKQAYRYWLTEDSNLSKLAKANGKLSAYGCRNAVIGGQYGKWKLKREPDKDDTINISLYFDEDGPSDPDEEKQKEKKGDEVWTGEGELFLPDFKRFVNFLQAMILDNKLFGDDI